MSPLRNIDDLLEEIVTLPSLPSSVAHITQLVSQPDCSLSEVGKAISSDPAIALKALRLVNSAFYGLGQKVSSVEQAVTLLGLKVIKNLVFSAAVFETLSGGAGELLKHSIACGLAMRAIAESSKGSFPIDPSDAFSYGLLHDVGKIIFEEFLADEMHQVQAVASERGAAAYLVEREVIGADHCEMGAHLALKWKLPDTMVGAIGGHHDLSRCEDPGTRVLAAALAVADYMATASGLPSQAGVPVTVPEEMWDAAGVSPEQIQAALDTFFAAIPELDELLELAT